MVEDVDPGSAMRLPFRAAGHHGSRQPGRTNTAEAHRTKEGAAMGMMDKVKGLLGQHGEKVTKGIDKAADMADKKTKGKYSDRIKTGSQKAKEQAEKYGREGGGSSGGRGGQGGTEGPGGRGGGGGPQGPQGPHGGA
jgi:hypothetical protein